MSHFFHLGDPQAGDGVRLLELPGLDVPIHRLRQRDVHGRQRHPFEADHPSSSVAGNFSTDELCRVGIRHRGSARRAELFRFSPLLCYVRSSSIHRQQRRVPIPMAIFRVCLPRDPCRGIFHLFNDDEVFGVGETI